MKAKLALATIIGLLACVSAHAQTPAAGDATAAPAASETAAPVANVAAPATVVEVAAVNTTDATAAPAAEISAPPAAEPPPAATATTAAPDTAEPSASASPSAVISIIEFHDLPLTSAIENLARQAGLNYILDPKVTFGQPGPDGRTPAPQPTINLRWEKLTAEQALMALLTTYNLQLVEDPKTRVARVTVKDPAAPDPLVTKVVQLKYASPSNIVAAVQSAVDPKRGRVVVDGRTSQLVVVATEKEQADVEKLVEQLDTPTKQVLIEAKILETTVNPKTIKGVNWSRTLSSQNITFGNGVTRGTYTSADTTKTVTRPAETTTTTLPGGREVTTTIPAGTTTTKSSDLVRNLISTVGSGGVSYNTLSGFTPETAFLNADGLNVALSFLNDSSDTKVISEPRLVTLDNQKANIDVGLMYPIVNVTASTANTTGGSSINYSNLTVNLDVTPRITANNFIEMRVLQSVVRLGPTFVSKVADQENVVDSFFTRRIETGVLIPSGNTLVLGGLISDEQRNGNTKVPLLGDLPVIGLAFRQDSKQRDRGNLLVFITPTVVGDEDFRPTESTFLKSTGDETAVEDWSAWDSGKPYDWSKPKKAAAKK